MMKKYLLFLIMSGISAMAQANLSEVHQVWENGQWKNLLRITPTYNANNSAIEESLTEIWNDQAQTWQNQSRAVNTILVNTVTESLMLQWDAATSQWINDKLYARDLASPIDYILKDWNGMAWQNEEKVFTEAFVPNESNITVKQIWNAGQWENDLRTSFVFDTDSSEQIEQSWQNNAWTNQTRKVRENLITTVYAWSGSEWAFSKRLTVVMGSGTLVETYDSVSQTWLPESQDIITYENVSTPEFTGETQTTTTQLYTAGNWVNSYRIITNTSVLLGNPESEKPTITLFPNPAGETLHLQSYSGDYAIYAVDGREIKRGIANEPQTAIEVGNLTSGMYILKMSGQSLRFVKN